jgi:predicted cupin superfamily sugar epimerase
MAGTLAADEETGVADFSEWENVMSLTAEQIIQVLGLEHATCGYVRETFRSPVELAANVLPAGYAGEHSLGNVLYFLVTPEAPVGLHRIRSDQMYHHYQGAPLEVLLLYADGRSEVKVVGQDLAAGMRPQLFIPGGTFHTARVASDDAYALLATSVWLRAEPNDVEMGSADELTKRFPAARQQIAEFTRRRD